MSHGGYMRYVFGILMFVSLSAFAGDWFCEETASERQGNVIKTCGMGVGILEGTARFHGLNQARHEFQVICQLSTDCKEAKRIIVSPGRTSCKRWEEDGLFHCARMLSFEIEE